MECQEAENIVKILFFAPLDHLFYLKRPQEPVLNIKIHYNSHFCLKYFENGALNPGIFPDQNKMNNYLRNIH